ncbi:MAG: hypothetical protein Q4C49_04870 [Bacillota bacterium]|nr:hypothetical protein [Bacillota bacterium]
MGANGYYQNLYSYLSSLKESLSSTCMSAQEEASIRKAIQSILELISLQLYESGQ